MIGEHPVVLPRREKGLPGSPSGMARHDNQLAFVVVLYQHETLRSSLRECLGRTACKLIYEIARIFLIFGVAFSRWP